MRRKGQEDRVIWEIDESTRGVEGVDDNGRPRPEYAASLGLVPAPFGRRALSATIEAAAYLVLQLPLLLVALPALVAAAASPDPAETLGTGLVPVIICAAVSIVLTAVFLIVQLVLHGRRGVTLGKACTGLRSVNVRTLERPGFWRGAVIRAVVLWASFAVPLVGPLLVIALSPFFDPERRGRGWADLAGATWLVDSRRGLNPYDVKRMRIARKTVATDLEDVRSELPSLATPTVDHGPITYIPAARSSGGVLGAGRTETVPPEAPVADRTAVALGHQPSPSAWTPPRLLPDGAHEEPPTPEPKAAPPAQLVLDTGRIIDVGSGILIGRDPAPVRGEPGLRPVAIDDPTMSVSKTHLALLRTGAAHVVVDRGSTNGSAVVRDGDEQALVPGAPLTLRGGDTIRFGDRHALIRIG
jgi:hypothetical protein